MNKPKLTREGHLEYTITQPFRQLEDGQVENVEEERKQSMPGSALDTEYLECVEPHAASSHYQQEFRVTFTESGSFFIQIAYQDAHDPNIDHYTPAQYINVEPVLRLGNK